MELIRLAFTACAYAASLIGVMDKLYDDGSVNGMPGRPLSKISSFTPDLTPVEYNGSGVGGGPTAPWVGWKSPSKPTWAADWNGTGFIITGTPSITTGGTLPPMACEVRREENNRFRAYWPAISDAATYVGGKAQDMANLNACNCYWGCHHTYPPRDTTESNKA